jgi:selenocysteine lyase/cysteine desulfurase
LKEAFGNKFIHDQEANICKQAMTRFKALGDKILLIGNNTLPKVCIFSFLIRAHVGENSVKFLNPAFVVSLLNDLFGIQSRSGCLCASMFGQKMLGIDLKLSGEYKEALFDGNELLRLGYTRINLNYFIPDEEIDYILSAVEFIANFGWMFLPHY